MSGALFYIQNTQMRINMKHSKNKITADLLGKVAGKLCQWWKMNPTGSDVSHFQLNTAADDSNGATHSVTNTASNIRCFDQWIANYYSVFDPLNRSFITVDIDNRGYGSKLYSDEGKQTFNQITVINGSNAV